MKNNTMKLGRILENKLGVNPLSNQSIGKMMDKGMVTLKYHQPPTSSKRGKGRGIITLSQIVRWHIGGLHALRKNINNNLWMVYNTPTWKVFTMVVDYITFLIKGGVPKTTTIS